MNCKICEEKFDTIYRIPRNLVCGHTFCEQCLKIYTKLDEINCPKCMKSSSFVSVKRRRTNRSTLISRSPQSPPSPPKIISGPLKLA